MSGTAATILSHSGLCGRSDRSVRFGLALLAASLLAGCPGMPAERLVPPFGVQPSEVPTAVSLDEYVAQSQQGVPDPRYPFISTIGSSWSSRNSRYGYIVRVMPDSAELTSPVGPGSRLRAVSIADSLSQSSAPPVYDQRTGQVVQTLSDGWVKRTANGPNGAIVRFSNESILETTSGETIATFNVVSNMQTEVSGDRISFKAAGIDKPGIIASLESADGGRQRALGFYELPGGELALRAVLSQRIERGLAFQIRLFKVNGAATESANNELTESDWSADGFGSSLLRVSTAGDVNGDGFSDFIIGAPNYLNADDQPVGRVFVYYGSATGPKSSPDWEQGAMTFGSHFGASVGPAGDLNGDGFGDIVVGAPGNINVGSKDTGAAYVFKGDASGLPTSSSRTEKWLLPLVTNGQFGFAVGYAGDVNQDGFDDLFVGAPSYDYDLKAEDKGAIFVWHGRENWFEDSYFTTTAAASWTANGTSNDAQLGYSASSIGDYHGDGYPDIAVGAPNKPFENVHHGDGRTTSPSNIGRTLVARGSDGGLSGLGAFRCCEPGTLFGSVVSIGGAMGEDGQMAVIDTAPAYNVTGSDNSDDGSVRLVSYSADNRRYDGNAARKIRAAMTLGDIDGDGRADFGILSSVGQERLLEVFFGGRLDDASLTLTSGVSSFATAGDVNGDGFSDTAVIKDDGVLIYYGQSPLANGTPYWTFDDVIPFVHSDAVGHGSAVTARGDFNGDGFRDIAIAAPESRIGYNEDAGVVSVYYGPLRNRTATFPDVGRTSYAEGMRFGAALAAVDFDNDGLDDLAVGVPYWSDGDITPGAVYLFKGDTQREFTSPEIITVGQDGAGFGSALAYAGDLNDDGYGDLVVGSPEYSETIANEGAVFVYLGRNGNAEITPDWYSFSGQALSEYGSALGAGRDLNGDGFEDVAVGAPGYDHAGSDVGAVFLWMGDAAGSVTGAGATGLGASGDVSISDQSLFGTQAMSRFGHSLAMAGDLDGDSRSELVAGIPFQDGAQVNSGAFQVLYGDPSGVDGSTSTVVGDQTEGKLGLSIGGAGDVNGDGFADLVVSAPYYDDTSVGNDGRVYVWFGTSGLRPHSVSSADWVATGQQSSLLGLSIAAGSDVNADGFDDLLIGAPGVSGDSGTVNVYSRLNPQDQSTRLVRWLDQARLDSPYHVQLYGTSDSAGGVRLHGRTANPFGRLLYTVDYKIAEFGHGSVLESPLRRGTVAALSGQDLFEVIQAPSNTLLNWSARFNYDNPFFPWGSWLTPPGGTHTEAAIRTGTLTVSRIAALFTVRRISDADSLELEFDATGTFSDHAQIARYNWEFGNGETGSGRTVRHRFSMPGYYDVTLHAGDALGNVDSNRKRIKVLPSDAVQLSFDKLVGTTGGSPADTSIFRSSLRDVGIERIQSVMIFDRSEGLTSAHGAWTGMDVDALSVLAQDCANAECVVDEPAQVSFDAATTYLQPGKQKPPSDDILHGTTADGFEIDHADATFDAFDADGVTATGDGFVSIGDGGVLSFHLPVAVETESAYLYVGEVADNEEIPHSQVYVSSYALPSKGISIVLDNEARLVAGDNFSVYVPEGALSNTQRVQFIESSDASGRYRLIARPGVHYEKPALFFIGNETDPPMKLSTNPPGMPPSTRVGNGWLFATHSQSTWGSTGPPAQCPGGVANCTLQTFNGANEGAAGCMDNAIAAFDSWLASMGAAREGRDRAGATKASCEYTDAVDALISISTGGAAQPCPRDPGRLCRSRSVTIPPHRPTMISRIYMPSKQYLQSLSFCEDEGSAAEALFDSILEHELEHVDINEEVDVTMDGVVIPFDNVPDGVDLKVVKAKAYAIWCKENVLPKLDQFHEVFDSVNPPLDLDDFALSDACAWCENPPIQQPVYCPCDDPAHGKPRTYASALECAVKCPSGLRCFAALCRVPAE